MTSVSHPVIGQRFRRQSDCSLDANTMAIAKKELGEDDKVRQECLMKLKDKLEDSDDLNSCVDDAFLLRFLRVSKFDLVKAHRRIRKYYQMRKSYPRIFDEFYPSSTTNAQIFKLGQILPYRPPDNSVLVVMKHGQLDSKLLSFDDYFGFDMLILEVCLQNPLTQVAGVTAIVDAEGLTLTSVAQHSPRVVKMGVDCLQSNIPIRYKHLHVVNASTIFYILYNLIQFLLPWKLRKRIVFHPYDDGWKSLHSYVPPEVLPEKYGGTLGPVDEDFTNNLVNAKEDYFRHQLNYGFVGHR